jgi:flagella basal body P-ring formation protein FlgA
MAYAPLTSQMLEVPKVVRRGQLVHLVMHAKGLDVSSQVVAQSDAGYGQQIDALYPTTKKRLRVKVIDSGTVEYLF